MPRPASPRSRQTWYRMTAAPTRSTRTTCPGCWRAPTHNDNVGDATGAGAFIQAQDGVRDDAHGLTGFCFGGGVVWRTIGSDQSVIAAVPFYGPQPPLDVVAHTRAAALGI